MRNRHRVSLGVESLENRDTPTVIWALGNGHSGVTLQATDEGVYQLVTPGRVNVIQPTNPRLSGLLNAAGVNPADVPVFTTTAVTASPSTYGQSVSFTAAVSPVFATARTPVGDVQFFLDGSAFGPPVPLGSASTAASPSLSTLSAGTHVVKASFANTDGFFFNSTSGDVTDTVAPAVLTVRADDASRAVATPNPTFTATITGFQNGEALAGSGVTGTPALGTTATTGSPVGTYPITAGPGTLAAGNYTFAFADGTLTVTGPVDVSGTPGDDTLTVGRTAAGTLTYVLNGGAPVALTGATSFTFHGLGGNNLMTVNLSGVLPLLSGSIVFDGGAGANTLTVDAAGRSVRALFGVFNVGGQEVDYANVAAMQVNDAAGVNAWVSPDTIDRAAAFDGLTAQERAVQALYLADLGRAGSKAELDGWVAALPPGATNLSQAVVAGIEGSFEARDHLVKSWFQTYLGRSAFGGEELPFVDLLGVTSEEYTLSTILGSSEFYARAQTLVPSGTGDERFIQALFNLLLNRSADPTEVAGWASSLPGLGRQGVALALLQSTEFRAVQVEGYFNALLHRPADPSEVNPFVTSGLDIRTIRFVFESSTEFFVNG